MGGGAEDSGGEVEVTKVSELGLGIGEAGAFSTAVSFCWMLLRMFFSSWDDRRRQSHGDFC